MASGLGNYAIRKILNHVFLTTTYTQETNLFVALLKSTPDAADAGSSLPGEVSGGSYARVTCNTWDDAGATQAVENSQTVTFAQATAVWGTVTHFAVMNHITTGSMIGWGILSASRVVSTGDTASFATGDLDVSITGTA